MTAPVSDGRRGNLLAVHSLDRLVYSVPDLDVGQRFYSAFGLDVRRHAERVDLHTEGHAHRWASLYEAGERKQLQYLRFGVYAEDMPLLAQRIATLRCSAEPHPLGETEGLWCQSPDGVPLQLVVAPKVSPSQASIPAPLALPLPGHGAAPSRSAVQPVKPRHLSHALFFTPDVPRMVAFCQELLGLRLSDHSGDLIAFLHTPHGSDHHLVAFAKSHAPGLHHISWDVGSVDEVGRGSEQMRNAGWAQGWGVGRHVLGSNYFYYVQDPWGSFCEYSFGIDFVPPNLDWLAADHDPADSLYVWGPSVPSNFITNLERDPPCDS